MKMNTEAKIQQHIIEITKKDTGEKKYLYKMNDEWKEISKEDYNKILGDNNGKQ